MLFWIFVSIVSPRVQSFNESSVVIRHIFDLHGRLSPGALTLLKVRKTQVSLPYLLVSRGQWSPIPSSLQLVSIMAYINS